MSKCGKCDSDISFMSVLNTPNPFKLKCGNCKAPISLSLVSAGIVAGIILAVISTILIYFYGSEGTGLKWCCLPFWPQRAFILLLLEWGW